MISPQIEEMSKALDNVVFLKVDVDEAEEAAAVSLDFRFEYVIQNSQTFSPFQ